MIRIINSAGVHEDRIYLCLLHCPESFDKRYSGEYPLSGSAVCYPILVEKYVILVKQACKEDGYSSTPTLE